MAIERITGSPTITSHGLRCLLNGVPKDQEPIAKWHAELNSKMTIAKAYQKTTEKLTNILPKLPTEMSTEKSTKNGPKLSSE